MAKWLRTSRRRRCTVPALAARLAVPPSQVRSLVRRRGSCRRQARRTSQRVEVVQLVSATRSAVAAAAATGSARRSAQRWAHPVRLARKKRAARRKRANMLLTPEERQKYASDPSVVERQLRWIMSR